MKREDMLAGYLEVLDQINESTHLALETLNTNADTVRMIVEELVNGSVDMSESGFFNGFEDLVRDATSMSEENTKDETIESIADNIVKQIWESESEGSGGIRAISISVDPDKYNVAEVMEIVKRKIADKNKEIKKTPKDDIGFGFEDFFK